MLAATASSTDVPTISTTEFWVLLGLTVGGVLLAGLVVIFTRSVPAAGHDTSKSMIRSWIAVALVFGFLIFCATAFVVADTSLRSTLFGGLVASVGAAVAFYFASKNSDQARSDILKAALGPGPGAFYGPHAILGREPSAGHEGHAVP